jgi:hypothetical protein
MRVASLDLDDVPVEVEGGEQLLMETPYPTFLFSTSCPIRIAPPGVTATIAPTA